MAVGTFRGEHVSVLIRKAGKVGVTGLVRVLGQKAKGC